MYNQGWINVIYCYIRLKHSFLCALCLALVTTNNYFHTFVQRYNIIIGKKSIFLPLHWKYTSDALQKTFAPLMLNWMRLRKFYIILYYDMINSNFSSERIFKPLSFKRDINLICVCFFPRKMYMYISENSKRIPNIMIILETTVCIIYMYFYKRLAKWKA